MAAILQQPRLAGLVHFAERCKIHEKLHHWLNEKNSKNIAEPLHLQPTFLTFLSIPLSSTQAPGGPAAKQMRFFIFPLNKLYL